MRRARVAVIPAAGKAERLPRALRPKELLPIAPAAVGGAASKVIGEFVLDAVRMAGVHHVCIVVSPEKQQVADFYGSGGDRGLRISYAVQHVPCGMAHAIDAAYAVVRGATVLMGMPDTVFQPLDALARLESFFDATACDVALGVFPTPEAARLGPVVVDAAGAVTAVLDKPAAPPVENTWGIACWGPAFTEFLHADLARWPASAAERTLGAIFQAAIDERLHVAALSFPAGAYVDVGTVEGLSAARETARGWAVSGSSR